MRLARALGVLVLLGCTAQEPARATTPSSVAEPPSGGLTFQVRGPENAPYDARSLGPSGRFVEIRARNEGERAIAVSGLAVTFSATRAGVVFPCALRSPSVLAQRLPASLAPGASLEIDRELGCTMPLPGAYQVQVFVRTDAAPKPRLVGTFALELMPGANMPRPLGVPGLFGLVTGGRSTPPLTPGAWSEGDYHVVLALINASTRAIRLGPATLSFVVYKKGSPYPCTSEAKPLSLPDELASGEVYTAQLPISCAPSEEGQYEVSGRFSMNGAEEIEIGRLGLNVTSNPLLYTPLPIF